MNNQKKGVNAVKKAKKNIQNDIFKWLLDKGLTQPDAKNIVCELPIVFAVKIETKGISNWCFLIEEENRRYDNILAISVDADKTNVIDEYFLFSVENFSRHNYLCLSQNDSLYNSSKIEIGYIKEIIKQFISELLIIKEREEEIKIAIKLLKNYTKA